MNVKPGDFPIGSPESRAAARHMLTERTEQQRIEVISHIPDPSENSHRPWATPWSETSTGQLMRMLYVPPGMTTDEARRAVGS